MHISAVALVVPVYDLALDFYVKTLGFECLCDIDQGGGKRWIQVRPKGAETALLLAKAVTEKQTAAIGMQTGGRVGFFLHTDKFDVDYRRLRDADVCFEEAPRTEVYGKVAVFQDPFGNRWDLLQLVEPT